MRVSVAFRSRFCTVVVLVAAIGMSMIGAKAEQLQLLTNPAVILPFEAEAKVQKPPPTVTFKVNAHSPARLGVKIYLPPVTPWLSTDFPMVEGRTLFEIETPLSSDGSWSVRPIFPVRGDYRIATRVKSSTQDIAADTFTVHVSENPSKYRNFIILTGVLLVFGLAGGWLIGGKQQVLPGQIAPTRVEILLSSAALAAIIAMASLAVSAEMNVHQHCEATVPSPELDTSSISNNLYSLELMGATEAVVGELAAFKAQVNDAKTHQPAKGLPLEVTVRQLEEEFVPLTFTSVTNEAGQVIWKECFFDGAPHQIEVRLPASFGRRAIKAQKSIMIEAIHPPLFRRVMTLVYMMIFLLIGLLVGFTVKGRQKASN